MGRILNESKRTKGKQIYSCLYKINLIKNQIPEVVNMFVEKSSRSRIKKI